VCTAQLDKLSVIIILVIGIVIVIVICSTNSDIYSNRLGMNPSCLPLAINIYDRQPLT
jgi:hypothetical protein